MLSQHDLPLVGPRNALVASARYLRDPFTALIDTGARYGDPFVWPTFFGRMVVTGDPAGARDILGADPDVYRAIGAEVLGPVIGSSNLILLSGEAHRAMRRFYGPEFHGQRVHDYGAAMIRIAREHASRWPRSRPFVPEDTMRAISLDVILEIVLGLGEPDERERFRDAILRLVSSLRPSFLFIPGLRRTMLGLSAWARYQRRVAEARALFEREVSVRSGGGSARRDLLSMLVAARRADGTAFSAQEILEQMVSLIGAGHETTGSALTWALFHIHRNPSVKERLLAELRGMGNELDPAAVAQLPFLNAVCCETLRLNPVAPLIGRTLCADLTVKGHSLPAGVSVGISIIALHRRPELYPEPERFVPERFLERTFDPFEYIPFGGGSRRCLGASFALYEMKLVLASILRDHTLTLIDRGEVRSVARNTTASPRKRIRMIRAA
jgi:cytochrome P450